MSRLIETSGPGFFGTRAILRLFAAGTQVRRMEESPRHAPEEPATGDTRDVQPSPRASLIAADPDQVAERPDSVAGSEFVDDRIRLRQ
jgi:hypothetical protein